MKSTSIVVTRRGGPEVLQSRQVEAVPGPEQVLVRVEAAGVSYGDVLARVGVIPGSPKPPYVPGYDVTGTVVEVGSGVTGLTVGDQVCALVREGAYGAYAVLEESRAVPLPAGLDPVLCAAGVLNGFIAHQMLTRVAAVTPRQRLLVHGASGGAGSALVQMGAALGAEIYGTCSGAKADLVAESGATPIDYARQDFVEVVKGLRPSGVDAVFDHLGGTHFWRSYSALRSPGVLVAYGQDRALRNGKKYPPAGIIGFLGGIAAPKAIPDGRRTTFYNAWSLEGSHPSAYREDLAAVLQQLRAGTFRPVVADVMRLGEAATAHRRLEERTVTGKVVLVPEEVA